MSGISNYTLNQKISNLQAQIQSLPTPTLDAVLTAGNAAGGLSITGLNDVALTTINGSAYPPAVGSDNLTDVLTAGDDAGGLNITNLNDVVGANFELNHFVNMKGLFKIHFHWWQVSSNAHVFTFKYRVQKNGEAKTTAWTDGSYTVGSGGEVFTYTSGTLNQISSLITLDLNALGVGVSDIIQFKLTRTDAIVGDIDIVMLDAHVQQDGAGSLTEYSKAIN